MIYAIGALVVLGAISLIPLGNKRLADSTTKTVAKVIAVFAFGSAAVLPIPLLMRLA